MLPLPSEYTLFCLVEGFGRDASEVAGLLAPVIFDGLVAGLAAVAGWLGLAPVDGWLGLVEGLTPVVGL